MRLLFVFLLLWFGFHTSASMAEEKRVALVVGNSAYQNVSPLANPVNDATAMAESLKRMGFDVIVGLDLDHRAFVKHMKEFARQLQGAELALFFYAGHGLQVDGQNFLAPVNTELLDEIDLEFETVRLDAIISQMEKEPRTNLIFLDACRNNPLARNLAQSLGTRNVGSKLGLAPVETGIGTLIAYSTQPGNVAYDGTGTHSPFSSALLDHLETPGADIAMVLRRVRQQVLSETGGKQVPWSNSSLTGDVVLKSGLREDLREFKRLEEEAFWLNIRDASDPVVLENYLKRYPDGAYVTEAQARIDDLLARKQSENERIAELKAQATQQANNLKKAEAEKERLLARLQAGTDDHEKRLADARAQMETRGKELEALTQQNRQLRETLEQSVETLEERLRQAEIQQAAREEEVARLQSEKSKLRDEVQTGDAVRQSLDAAIEDASKSALETTRIRTELADVRARSETEIASQTQELLLARQELEQAKQNASGHLAELQKLKQEKDAYAAQYAQKLQQSEEERKALEVKLAALEEKNSRLENSEPRSASAAHVPNKVASVHLDRSGRAALQMSLKQFGYDPGATDGTFGPKTFEAIMAARVALNLPAGSHVDQALISLLPDVSKLYGAYDGDWVVIRVAMNKAECGWTQVRQRLDISNGSISGSGYSGEVFSDGSIEMSRSFIHRHKRRRSDYQGRITETGGSGTFAYEHNDCQGEFVLRKGDVVNLKNESFYRFDKKDRDLVRSIQSELNRLGCDVGVVDGVWGGKSKRGLETFGTRQAWRNDNLPVAKSLLELLKEAPDGLCTQTDLANN